MAGYHVLYVPMNFIVDHVLETLVVCWSKEYLCIHFTSSKSTINDFITTLLIFVIVQQIRHLGDKLVHCPFYIAENYLLYSHGIIEWSSITNFTFQCTNFRCDTFEQVTNCHTRWNSMRVDNQIRLHTFSRK